MIVVFGGTGFVGGHLVDALAAKKRPFRCLVRSGRSKSLITGKGGEAVIGDITDAATLRSVIGPGDFVIHLVGIIAQRGSATFQRVHVDGTRALVSAAVEAGAGHFFYQSALGADRSSWSDYLRTKAEAEDIVAGSGLPYTIFRPSLIIGPWDGFTKRLMDMLKLSPVVPIPGDGKALFQPVYIGDWVRCMERVLESPGAFRSLYEIGGPEHLSYRAIVETLAAVIGSHRPSFGIPMGLMKLGASIFEKVLPSPPVTTEQLRLLEQDNVTDPDCIVKNFGFSPLSYRQTLQQFIPGTT